MDSRAVTVQHDLAAQTRQEAFKCRFPSRIPYLEVPCDQFIQGIEPKDLPCGGCSYCIRADSQWGAFTREVDDAVPVTSLGIYGTKGVVHDAQGVLGTGGGSHGEPLGPMVCDTYLDADQYSSGEQSYRDISAGTVRVGANNQVGKNGKPVCCDGDVQKLAARTCDAEISTTKGDWVTTRSLLRGAEQEVGQRRYVHRNCVLWGHLWREFG